MIERGIKGFTIIEVMVAVGLITIIGSLALFVSMDFYRSYNLDVEVETIIILITRARGRAVNNIDATSHGIYIDEEELTLFRGESYASRDEDLDEVFPRAQAFEVDGLSEIVFDQLTGEASATGTITISGQGRTAIVEINNEGRIDW